MNLIPLFLSFASIGFTRVQGSNSFLTERYHEQQLYNYLLPKLPKYAGPQGYETEVFVNPLVVQILHVNEREGYWTACICIPISFQIPNATWNYKDFGNIFVFQLQKELMWTPGVTVDGAIEVRTMSNHDLVSISADGWVTLQGSDIVAKIACSFDVRKFPFDDQICNFDLEPTMVYNAYFLKEDTGFYYSPDRYRPNDEWDIVNLDEIMLTRRNRTTNRNMEYKIHFRRKPLYYLITIVSPVTVIYLLSGLAFFLPSDDGEKLSFGVTILLAQIVAVSAMSDIFPASSNNVPLLLYFVSGVTLHMAIMCLESVIVLGLSQNGWRKWMSPNLRSFIASKYMHLIGLKPFTAKPTNKYLAFGAKRQSETNKYDDLGHDPEEESFRGNSELLQQRRENNHLRWRFLAMVVDRILLISHMIVVVVNLSFFAHEICT